MSPGEREIVKRKILEVVPHLHSRGSILAATPRGRVLRGFCIEKSSDEERVYVWCFVQPLYVPATTTVLSLGKRIGGPSRSWSTSDIDTMEQPIRDGAGFFAPLLSPEELSRWEVLDNRTDEYGLQAKAFSLLLSGRREMALPLLRELAAIDDGPHWRRELGARCSVLASLAVSNLKSAIELLDTWQGETIAKLRVGEIP
jgi:hypothetical protein